jgi:cysteine-rich repeat protein
MNPTRPRGAAARSFLRALTPLFLVLASGNGQAQVSSADEVCPTGVDPCNVTSRIDVAAGAVLDFGTRTVNVTTNSGRFFFAGSGGELRCGDFHAFTGETNAALNVASAARVVVKARRACSSGGRPCIDVEDCQLGACNTRRCSGDPTRPCTGDASCQLGSCMPNRRCADSASVRCTTDDDCQLGICPLHLTCSNASSPPLVCNGDEDCDFGTCSMGSGSIRFQRSIQGNSAEPAELLLQAADHVSIERPIHLNSQSADSDGGELDIVAAAGDVTIAAKLALSGGSSATGGRVQAVAGRDIVVASDIEVTGGDFDGGSVAFVAGRDIAVSRSINANAATRAGFGGEILLKADRDLTVTGVGPSSVTVLSTDGSTDAANFAGDGGTQELTAGRHLLLGPFTRFRSIGSQPDGFGGDLLFEAGGNFGLDGQVQARAAGGQGGGGFLEIATLGSAAFGSSSSIVLTGGAGRGGVFALAAEADVHFAGNADVGAGSGGDAGSIWMAGGDNLTLAGSLTTSGSGPGELGIEACRLVVAAGGLLDNASPGGANRLLARENLRTLSGSTLRSSTGSNVLEYRDPAKPPLLAGIVTPAPTLLVDPSIAGCPVCGNAEIDDSETCDDGNLDDGDGCSSDCQNERCIDQTAGYPDVALCDDGLTCTIDTCNTLLDGGTCQSVLAPDGSPCDDGVDCTVDACIDGECVSIPDDDACNDGDPCSDSTCSAIEGCLDLPTTATCNDGLFCTVDDLCSDFACTGSPRVCNDGLACTADECSDELGACIHHPVDSACDNGVHCDGAERCDPDEGCLPGEGVDCSSFDGECTTGICDESAAGCVAIPIREGLPCDDGLFCSVEDHCIAGACTGVARDCTDGAGCTIDACSDAAASCLHTPDHNACANGLVCDGPEICDPHSGCVAGVPPDCSGLDGPCARGVCEEAAGGCVASPAPEAPTCDATVQDRNQQRCLARLLRAARVLGNAIAQQSVSCVQGAARDSLPAEVDAATCLDADLQRRIARARAKLEMVLAKSCRPAPDFGFTDEETVSGAYLGELAALLLDAFPNLDATLEALRADDPTGRCAVTLPAGLRRLGQAMHKEAESCIRTGLRSHAITGGAGIEACLDAIVGDPAGKIGKATLKLGRRLLARCEPGLLDRAFSGLAPICDVYGRGGDGPGLALCARDRLQCRLCRAFNRAWGIERDCDVFDDGEANGSCPECGNRALDPGEECDDGPLNSDALPDACRTNCAMARCGDGVLDADEECDDGNGIDDDGCTNSCTVCGNGVVSAHEECDDGNLDDGDCCSAACAYEAPGSACDGPEATDCTAPGCDGAGTCASLPANNGAPCDDGDVCSRSSSCSGGTCTAASLVLSGAACRWMVVANAGIDSQRRLQIGGSARADGRLCSNFTTAGSGARIGGDLVTTRGDHTTDGVTFGDTTTNIDSVDVVTRNSRVRASAGTLPGLGIGTLGAGQRVSKSPSGVYDTTGADSRVAECQGAQNALESMLGLLDNLPTTHDFGATHASIVGGSIVDILAPNTGGLNILDFAHLEGSGNVTVNLNGGGSPDTVVVLRIAGRLASSQNWTWSLTGGLTPDRLLFYVRGSTNGSCTIGESNAGGGTLLCPNARVVIKRQSVWDGAVFGGGSTATAVELGNNAILNHVAFTGF